MQAVVLAGGLATRMRPQTAHDAQVDARRGRPAVRRLAARAARAGGFRDVVMCIAHLGEQIRAHVGDGARFGVARHAGRRRARRSSARPARSARALPLLDDDVPRHLRRQLPAVRLRRAAPRRSTRNADCDGVMAVFKNEGAGTRRTSSPTAAWVAPLREGRRAIRRSITSTTARPRCGASVIAALPAGRAAGPRRDPAGPRRAEALAGVRRLMRGSSRSARRKGWPSSIDTSGREPLA